MHTRVWAKKMIRTQNGVVSSMPESVTLAEFLSSEQEPAAGNRKAVEAFYEALASNDTAAVSRAVDLEWSFHGPPHCKHLMRLLTGESRRVEFKFKPRSVTGIGDRVVVEGWEGQGSKVYWAHVWSLEEGIITQLREYFDTWLTVIVRVLNGGGGGGYGIIRLWQSEPKERLNRSLPDVVLPIGK